MLLYTYPIPSKQLSTHVYIPHPTLSTADIAQCTCPKLDHYTVAADHDCSLGTNITIMARAPLLLEEVLVTLTEAY